MKRKTCEKCKSRKILFTFQNEYVCLECRYSNNFGKMSKKDFKGFWKAHKEEIVSLLNAQRLEEIRTEAKRISKLLDTDKEGKDSISQALDFIIELSED